MKKIHENTAQSQLQAKIEYRDKIDLLRSRIYLLTGKDRLMMTMHLDNGNSFRQMAQLAGLNESTISRRICRLAKRLLDGQYVICLRNRDKYTRAELNIARDYFLTGLSIKKLLRSETGHTIASTIP